MAVKISNDIANGAVAGSISSMEDLEEAIRGLSGRWSNKGNDLNTSMRSLCWHASTIRSCFNGVNQNIVSAWETVEAFTRKLNIRVEDLVENFYQQLNIFIEETQGHEKEIHAATVASNDLAEQILKELGL